ncbi:MAG: BNR repeat-containing protein [Candidatus Marinimicrobia bacterium]|nr:BNR repeat-containing protein [Candidatus Neomarinimicrobiota bacterium]MCF7880250.1 BNR repeat-containing protein [Candidatus Neomarinimicrobiota bacterium]
MKAQHLILAVGFALFLGTVGCNQSKQIDATPRISAVGDGWAKNSVNAVIFRKNSLVTHHRTQFIAYYDSAENVILGKRKVGTDEWTLRKTRYLGNAEDAHNSISMMVDGDGYLHMAWDHHNTPLRYCRSESPGSLEMSDELAMTGKAESRVSYPEFYRLPDGDLLFFYRDGESGRGNLVINKYDVETQEWTQIQDNLISGESERNAYWQVCVGAQGAIHISWVWRESPDVASNHDLCYAKSTDGGVTWMRSTGKEYALPITASTAEYALKIPQQSELINQTSMTTDAAGNPYIASYWRAQGDSVPQFQLVYRRNNRWEHQNTGFRETPFSLSGAGTKQIPISRPQIVVSGKKADIKAYIIFRDAERGNRVSVAMNGDLTKNEWEVIDLTHTGYGSWEPTYDTELWKSQGILSLFLQNVTQIDSEGLAKVSAQPVKVLDWRVE